MSEPDVIEGRARIADRLGVSERTVSRWTSKGLLVVRKNGRTGILRVRQTDLERHADQASW